MNHKFTHDDLESRIKDQFPAVIITLVSVLVGLTLVLLLALERVSSVWAQSRYR